MHINWSLTAILCIFLIGLPATPQAARILGFFPSTSKSHLLIHCSIADTLARAGHNVTVLGGTPNVNKNAKYRYIDLKLSAGFHQTMAPEMVNNPQPFFKRFGAIISNLVDGANKTMANTIMQQFLQDHGEGSFDLVIIGYMMNEVSYGLGAHFKCPMIVSFVIQSMHVTNKLVGNPDELSYVPTLMSELRQPMNFKQRVLNYFYGIIDAYIFSQPVQSGNQALYM